MTEIRELEDWTFYRTDDSAGEQVRLPHDAMLGERRSADSPTGNAGAYFWGGRYRYEHELSVPESWADKHVLLEFEGVMGKTRVLANDRELAYHEYGYTGFVVDLTEELSCGETLPLQVEVDNAQQPNSRWYAGSGLYRPVRLVVQDEDRIEYGGVSVSTEFIRPAQVRVHTRVHGRGNVVVRIERNGVAVAGRAGDDVSLYIPDAELWSAENPALYQCRSILRDDQGAVLDEACVSFGIRTLSWGPRGFLVNGEPVKLRGGCVHHDNGILGARDLPVASRRKVALLKSWGFNAIRSAHNPISRSMLEACDELGMYVMDEYADMWYQPKNPYDYACDFFACHERDLVAMVDKDFNHPCVVMYSIGNENVEPACERGVAVAHELAATLRYMDPSRPVTAGVNPAILFASKLGIDSFNADGQSGSEAADASLAYNTYVAKMGDVMEFMAGTYPVGRAIADYLDELDIAGYNYATSRYRPDLRRKPERLVFGSETMPYDIARNWRMVEADPRIIGDFMWTSWDYLGECSLAAWSDDPTPVSKPYPWLCADTGALDLLGDANGEAALARTVWTRSVEPLLFVRPASLPRPYTAPWRGTNSVACWSWRGSEGNACVAEVYTNAPIAKLYLNGKHLGTRRVCDGHADFKLRYQPGELVAVACTAGGLELGRRALKSAEGELRFCLQEEYRYGGVAFVRVDVCDERGVVEGGWEQEIALRVCGGELLAFGSAAQKSERSYLEGCFAPRYGRAMAVVRLEEGACTLEASAAGLPTACLELRP
ncbi:MAG: glycoside hydrolase family 2 TIM barrel-domain containing protein [Coriobacteriales bacterium]|nr:glycoside hydrolase family 2 TIM barrel-domain containing protein [Coriobacteriales bacterium]